jgi:hypothetical protein
MGNDMYKIDIDTKRESKSKTLQYKTYTITIIVHEL